MDPQQPFDPTNRPGPQPADDPFASDISESRPYAAARPIANHPLGAAAPQSSSLHRSKQPRWWTPLAISGLSLAVFMVASAIMAVVALVVVHGSLTPEMLRDPRTLEAVSASRLGLFIVVVLPQIALVVPAIVAATLSSVPTRERLGLVRGRWPIWAWFAAAAATPLVGMISGIVVGMFLDESDTLKQMTQIFRDHGQNGFLLPLAFMIGATPAFCEEILFRGYVQTRLTRSLGPVAGIGLASFLFAIFHLDPVHIVAVFPLGLFLGWITWQSGSLFPAMLGHFVNNVISVVAVVLAPEPDPDVLALPAITFTVAILGLGLLGMMAVVAASVAYGRPDPAERIAAESQVV